MASSLSRCLLSKFPQNPRRNPWLATSQTNSSSRLPFNENPFRFFDASTLICASRFPVEIPTAARSNILRSCLISAGENPPLYKPDEPSNQTIPAAKPRSNAPTLFKPYWVSSSQTLFSGVTTVLKLDSARYSSRSRSRTSKTQKLINPQNPTQHHSAQILNDRVESENPLPSGLAKTPEVFEKKFRTEGDTLSKVVESRQRAMDELRKTLGEGADGAAIDARQAKQVLETLRNNTRDLSMALGLLGVAHFGPWIYKAIHTGEFSLSSWAAFAFPCSLAFLVWQVLKRMDMFERRVDQGNMSPLSRTVNVSGEIAKLFLRFRVVALLCIVAACAEPVLAHVMEASK